MHATIRKLFCYSLALVFLNTTTLLKAQSTASTASSLTPPQITSAHTIFLSNAGGSTYFNAFTGGPDRAYTQLLGALENWNRYQIVQSPSQADLIFEIQGIAPATASPGNDIPGGCSPQLILRIRDPQSNAILWTTSANVRASGLQKSRDKGFDQSIAVLVDHVRQLTGEQLSPTEQAAVRSNASTYSKAMIGLLVAGAVGAVIMAVVGIHLVHEHQNQTLTSPTLPTCPTAPACPI
ncbi:hypothetical protein GCM10011507_13760 [Edaphobacter acidisoli]|uniref:DUF4136 domain-containing protein n=1 Tax=Edaphobacter acidisoli TaxID=2040573 RepID=A0A916W3L5_9BACT|nr:hypothetical protein [Edaphobacter acidisoli]GGA63350.1 hypothetical protein GCM10011507_13760 [Edaphobacter acidisoli]